MFNVLTYLIRFTSLLQSMSLVQKSFLILPQCVWHIVEIELIHKTFQLTAKDVTDNPKITTFFISIDFEKWNLYWCKESADPTFRMLDEMFGEPGFFTYSHAFFKEAPSFV